MNPSDTLITELKSAGDLPDVAAFVAVVGAGGFSAAARRAGSDKSQLSRRVRALEERLGVRLLHRTTRTVRPTEAGERLYTAIVGPLAEVLFALSEAGTSDALRGLVRLAGPSWLAQDVWSPLLERTRQTHPELRIDLRLSDTIEDFVSLGYDLALRLGNLPDSTLVARRAADWNYLVVATPEWAAAHPIEAPEDLAEHWLHYAPYARSSQWTFAKGDERRAVRMQGRISVDEGTAMQALVTSGSHCTALPDILAWRGLAAGTLVRVLPEWRVDHAHAIYLVVADRKYMPKRVRAVQETLLEVLAMNETRWASAHDG